MANLKANRQRRSVLFGRLKQAAKAPADSIDVARATTRAIAKTTGVRKTRAPSVDFPSYFLPLVSAGTYNFAATRLNDANRALKAGQRARAIRLRTEALKPVVSDLARNFPPPTSKGWEVSYAPQKVPKGFVAYYLGDTKTIALSDDPFSDPHRLVTDLVHEFDHAYQQRDWRKQGLPDYNDRRNDPLYEFDSNLRELQWRHGIKQSPLVNLALLHQTYGYLRDADQSGSWQRAPESWRLQKFQELEQIRIGVCREAGSSGWITSPWYSRMCGPKPPDWRVNGKMWDTLRPEPPRRHMLLHDMSSKSFYGK